MEAQQVNHEEPNEVVGNLEGGKVACAPGQKQNVNTIAIDTQQDYGYNNENGYSVCIAFLLYKINSSTIACYLE